MSQKIYVEELKQHLNKEIISEFLVTQKDLREGAKDFYIRLALADKTGSIPGNVWNNAKAVAEKFKEGDIILVKGVVISYKSQIQLTVNKITRLESEECDLTNFMETTGKDVNKLSDRLFKYIESINNNYLKELLLLIYEDKEFYTAFAKAPAAKSWHHNYLGGLLEHTVAVAAICDFMSVQYPIDRDVLLTGALLHDIGKVFEYDIKPNIEFSVIARLVGHIPLADQYVSQKAAGINNFPADLLMKILLGLQVRRSRGSCSLNLVV